MNEVIRLTVSGVLADLRAGLTRKEIGEKYHLNGLQVKELFRNEHLKGRKTIKEKGAAFVLVDDLSMTATPAAETAVAEEPVVAEEAIDIEEVGEVAEEQAVQEEVIEEEAAPEAVEAPVPPVSERKLWE